MEFQQPLINLQKAKIKQKKTRKRTNLIAVPIGIAIGILIAFAENIFDSVNYNFTLFFILALLGTMSLQVILHELGHLIFGLFSDYRFVSFRVFSFAIYKKDGKLRFGRYRVPGTFGQCFMCPTKEDDAMPYRALLLGGVIVNTAVALLFVIPLVFLYHILFWRLFSYGMIFWGITFAIGNGIPRKSGAIANDGYHIKILPQSAFERASFFNQLRISAAMTEGKRFSEMPEEWFSLPEHQTIDPLSATLRTMEAEREMDLGRLDQAKTILLDLATRGESLSEFQLSSVLTELLYLEMVGKHRLDQIEILRKELETHLKITKRSFTALRIEITYHYLFTGDLNQVETLEKAFHKNAKHFPFSGEIARENLLILYPKALYQNWRNTMGN